MDDKLKIPGLSRIDPALLLLEKREKLNSLSGRTEELGDESANKRKAEEAAKQFEGLLLEQMFKSMWSSLPAENQLLGSQEEEYFRDMFNQALAESISEGQGIGIKEVVFREMKNKNEE